MKKTIIWLAVLTVMLILNSTAFPAEKPNPFGLEVGKTTYEDCIKILKTRNWNYQEYEKKQFKLIDEKDPARGKNTFILAKLKDMKGARGIRLFFSSQSILDAIIVALDPSMFAVAMDELDGKYDLVKKNLMDERPLASLYVFKCGAVTVGSIFNYLLARTTAYSNSGYRS